MFATTPPELAAVRRYAATGDPEAFELLVRRYESMVRGACRRVLGSGAREADAQDAVQETFFALARQAGQVRSHPGAWLHRCAVRTSIDLLRSDRSRRRAEARAGNAAEPHDTPADPTWAELKPVFDAALAELPEADRELIVTRYLLAAPTGDLARAAGVHAGTMSRRLAKALERLRASLARRGVAAPAAAVLAGVLASGARAAAAAPGGASASLMEIGLGTPALTGTHAAGSAAAGKLALVAGLLLLAAGGGAAALWWPRSTAGPLDSAGTVAGAAGSVGAAAIDWDALPALEAARPSSPIPPLGLVAYTRGGTPMNQLIVGPASLTITVGKHDPDQTRTFALDLLGADDPWKPTRLRARLRAASGPPDRPHPAAGWVGRELDILCSADGPMLRLDPQIEGPDMPPGSQAMLCARPEGLRRPADSQASGGGVAPGLEGPWQIVEQWQLRISADEIEIGERWFAVRRFRVLEWTVAGEFARVQAIETGGQADPGMIGKRVRLLMRRDQSGWTIAHHRPGSARLNEWPTTVRPSQSDDLCVYRFVSGAAR